MNIPFSPQKSLGKFKNFIKSRPLLAFFITFGLLITLIYVANQINKPELKTEQVSTLLKDVTTFKLNSNPTIQTQGQLKKAGIVTVRAQTAGIVHQSYIEEGDQITQGRKLLWISTNYTGGTISSLQRQQAQTNYNNLKQTFDLQQQAIENQRDIANRNLENTEKLREINEQSIQDTRDLLDLNNNILSNLSTQIQQLEASSSAQSQITALNAQRAQLSSGIAQLNASLRATEYQTDPQANPARIPQLQRDLTEKQLTLQEKSLDLQLEISRLSLQLAQVTESLNYPSSPFSGRVERVYVNQGQSVNPGDALVTINSSDKNVSVDAFVSEQIIKQISKTSNSSIKLDNNKLTLVPDYISSEPIENGLYLIKYILQPSDVKEQANGSYLPISIEISTTSNKFVPLDSVHQTQEGSYVYVVEYDNNNTKAKSVKVELGQITGSYVEVLKGLTYDDQIILNRNILEGDQIKVTNKKL